MCSMWKLLSAISFTYAVYTLSQAAIFCSWLMFSENTIFDWESLKAVLEFWCSIFIFVGIIFSKKTLLLICLINLVFKSFILLFNIYERNSECEDNEETEEEMCNEISKLMLDFGEYKKNYLICQKSHL